MDRYIDQAIQVLSEQIQAVVDKRIEEASFPRMREGRIIKKASDGKYLVETQDRSIELPVYGTCEFEPRQKVWLISPYNSKNLMDMFILGMPQ